jgi:hypothetical protein
MHHKIHVCTSSDENRDTGKIMVTTLCYGQARTYKSNVK